MNLRLVNNEGTAFKVAEVQAALVDPETGARVKVYKPLKVGKSVGKGKTVITIHVWGGGGQGLMRTGVIVHSAVHGAGAASGAEIETGG